MVSARFMAKCLVLCVATVVAGVLVPTYLVAPVVIVVLIGGAMLLEGGGE